MNQEQKEDSVGEEPGADIEESKAKKKLMKLYQMMLMFISSEKSQDFDAAGFQIYLRIVRDTDL